MPSPSTLFELSRTRFAIIGRGCATRSLLAKRGGRTRDRTLDLSLYACPVLLIRGGVEMSLIRLDVAL